MIRAIFVSIYNFFYHFYKRFPYYLIALYWYVRNLFSQHKYTYVEQDELIAKRKSDTVFICGTGRSLLDISPESWDKIGQHDVLSFRDFPQQSYVNADFHVTGEIDDVDKYAQAINQNPRYDKTTFLVQRGWRSIGGNSLIGKRLLPFHAPIFRYKRKTRGSIEPLSKNLDDGIVHGFNSVTGMINLAYLLGWKNIVLVGIDMQNHTYFNHDPNTVRAVEKENVTNTSPYTNADKTLELIELWNGEIQPKGINLFSYNPNSLLKKIIPIFDWDKISKA